MPIAGVIDVSRAGYCRVTRDSPTHVSTSPSSSALRPRSWLSFRPHGRNGQSVGSSQTRLAVRNGALQLGVEREGVVVRGSVGGGWERHAPVGVVEGLAV